MNTKRPAIGITPDWAHPEGRAFAHYELRCIYADAVLSAGGLPFVLPYTDDAALLDDCASRLDGLLVTGGGFDVPPEFYGEERKPYCGPAKVERTRFERAMMERALAKRMPVLGICGGMQLLNVVLGGTLVQDIKHELPDAHPHEQKHDRTQPAHGINVVKGTLLANAIAGTELQVNSTHHQAVHKLGCNVVVSARAPDGVVEAIEGEGLPFAVGVQWHPEALVQTVPANLGIYQSFVKAAATWRR